MSRTDLTDEQFGELFHTFEHTAFRLEVRDRYNVDYERAPLARFLADKSLDLSPGDWSRRVRADVAAGKWMGRVRVVSEPHTDYTRYLLNVTRRNVAAGEDIRYLPRNEARRLGVPEGEDFWLFDSRQYLVLHCDDDDEPFRYELVDDPVEVLRRCQIRDLAWHHAIRWEDYAVRHGVT